MTTGIQNRRRSGIRGQSLVEFAVIIVIFLVFLFGILDWGITLWIHQTIAERTAEAARYAAVRGEAYADGTVSPAVANIILCGTTAGCGSGFMGLTADKITVTKTAYEDESNGTGAEVWRFHVVVTVSNYQITQFTPFFGTSYLGEPIVAAQPWE